MQSLPLQPMTVTTDIPEGLSRNENHLTVMIGDNWFSYTRKGDAIQFHLFSKNPKSLSDSCEIFIKWLFDSHEWCKMLLVTISKRSLINLAKKHGFIVIKESCDSVFMARKR